MAAAKEDITIPAGQIFEMVVDVQSGPADLTGYVGSMMIRGLRTDLTPLATISSGSFTVNPSTRQVTVRIPGAETELFEFRRGVYDLLITGPGGDEWRLVEGRVLTSLAVTR
jgi:hypothetical protein